MSYAFFAQLTLRFFDNQIRIIIGCNREGSGDYVHDSYEILAGSNRANLLG